MTHFNPLEGTALLRSKGVYTDAKLFERDGKIYAKRGSGFIRLLANERTTLDRVFWSKISGTPWREAAGDVLVSHLQITAAA